MPSNPVSHRTSAFDRSKAAAIGLVLAPALFGSGSAESQEQQSPRSRPATEQIVIFRHGEKPQPEAFGQLSCKGLNRALALPEALQRYGMPSRLFAPDPAIPYYPDVSNAATPASGHFPYVRPLMTIDPLAIIMPSLAGKPSLPVDTHYAYNQADQLATALLQPEMFSSTVFIAWEHVNITTLARDLMQRFANTSGHVPDLWDDDDYDSVYAITIERTPGGDAFARFEHPCEGLGDGGHSCPLPAGRPELSSACPEPAAVAKEH